MRAPRFALLLALSLVFLVFGPATAASTKLSPCKGSVTSPVFSYPPEPHTSYTATWGGKVITEDATGWTFKVGVCMGQETSPGPPTAYVATAAGFKYGAYLAGTNTPVPVGPSPDQYTINLAGSSDQSGPPPCIIMLMSLYDNGYLTHPAPIRFYFKASWSAGPVTNPEFAQCGAHTAAKAKCGDSASGPAPAGLLKALVLIDRDLSAAISRAENNTLKGPVVGGLTAEGVALRNDLYQIKTLTDATVETHFDQDAYGVPCSTVFGHLASMYWSLAGVPYQEAQGTKAAVVGALERAKASKQALEKKLDAAGEAPAGLLEALVLIDRDLSAAISRAENNTLKGPVVGGLTAEGVALRNDLYAIKTLTDATVETHFDQRAYGVLFSTVFGDLASMYWSLAGVPYQEAEGTKAAVVGALERAKRLKQALEKRLQ